MTLLFWHRRDLRLADNLGLAMARQREAKVVGLFCLDPQILQRDDVAAVRVVYLLGCLVELQRSYQQKGGQLLVLQGDPVVVVPQVAIALAVTGVYWNLDVEPYSQERDRAVTRALQTQGIPIHTYWDQLLHAPAEIATGTGQPYTVYTPFWRNWSDRPKPEPLPIPESLVGLTAAELTQMETLGAIAVPTAKALGFNWERELLLPPGEAAAEAQLNKFCQRAIYDYQEQRNRPDQPGTSLLSPALKFGAIGIRTVWAAAQASVQHCRSDEASSSIRTWQQELAWREFYQHALYHFPKLAEGPFRPAWQRFPWVNDLDHFQAWCEGRTGYPIVDAAMRQLNETGWMHNRCRMIVASFLTKDLLIDWRWGEKYFMQRLVDGDVAANNGGWQWSASSGMDPRPLRIFNPASQAQKFDPDADYIRQWLPELRSVDTAELVTGKILPLERDRCGYPAPIVDHSQQQRRFKQLYTAIKGANMG